MKAIELVKVETHLPEHLQNGFDSIRQLSREQCTQLWAALTGKGIEILRQRAQLIFHFKKEGWNIHELGNGHSIFYLEIAYGRLLPELFIAIADKDLLDCASRLNIPDQIRVVQNEKVPVFLSFKENNQPYFQDMFLQEVPPKLAKELFRDRKICTREEQIARARTKSKRSSEPKIGRLKPDSRHGVGLSKIGNATISYSLAEMEACVSALKRS